jgi:hypothetical protein
VKAINTTGGTKSCRILISCFLVHWVALSSSLSSIAESFSITFICILVLCLPKHGHQGVSAPLVEDETRGYHRFVLFLLLHLSPAIEPVTSHRQRTDSALLSCSIGLCFTSLVCCIASITGLDPSDHSDPIDSIALFALTTRLLDCIDCIRHGTVTLPCFDRPLRVLCIVDGQPQSIHPTTPQVRESSVGAYADHCIITIELAAVNFLKTFTARPQP